MDTLEILDRLARFTGVFEREAVEAAIAQRDEMVPVLLDSLEDSVNRAAELDAQDDYMGHIYAMFLLAQFRETRAYPLVMRFAALQGELVESLCGDFVYEDLGRVMASVCGDDVGPIQTLIENSEADEWVRAAAVTGLMTLVWHGERSRDWIVDYFGSLMRGKLERVPSGVWNEVVACAGDLYPEELMGDIRQAYADELVDPEIIELERVETDLETGKDALLADFAENPHFRMVKDTVAEMEWWACFQPQPQRRVAPKIGRNEPCPCGSGKKFKKCCGA